MPLLNALDFTVGPNFSVRYRASAEPQEVFITAELSSAAYMHITNALLTTEQAAEFGVTGSDCFAPALGRAQPLANARDGRRVTATIEVAGFAPVAVRRLVEELRAIGMTTPIASLEIVGALPLDDSNLSITEHHVRAWLDDTTAYVKQWPHLSFPVVRRDVDTKGVSARVAFAAAPADDRRKNVQTRFLAWRNFVSSYVSPAGTYVPQQLGQTMPKYAWKASEIVMRIPEFERTRGPSADALVNMLQRMHEEVAPIAEVELKF
jgi:hypothetical protein